MVPKGKEKALMTLDQVVARVKTLQGIEGCGVGDRWEGHTDNQLRVDVFVKKNTPGVSLLWEYHDGKDRHQCGKHSVTHADIDRLVTDIGTAIDVAVPGRYVHEVEVRTAAERDPALLEAARLRGEEPAGGITREAFADAVRVTPEVAARLASEGQRVVYSTPGQVAAARAQDLDEDPPVVGNPAPDELHEEGFDPSIEEARRVHAQDGPVEVDVEEGPPPEGGEQEPGDVDPDVEDQADQG